MSKTEIEKRIEEVIYDRADYASAEADPFVAYALLQVATAINRLAVAMHNQAESDRFDRSMHETGGPPRD
jgi:hypothetical protein